MSVSGIYEVLGLGWELLQLPVGVLFWEIPPTYITNPDVISYAHLLPSERIKMLFGSAPAPRSDHPFLY
jgi:hypothetical protein